MFPRTLLLAAGGLFATIIFTGCSGSGVNAPAPSTIAGTAATTRLADEPVTATLPSTQDVSGSVTLHSTTANATVTIANTTTAEPAGTARPSHGACPPNPPPIVLYNPFPFPVTVDIDQFQLRFRCSVDGLLFGASAYQSHPVPQTLVSTKLGNATGTGHTLTFKPTVSQLTFPAKTALTISILAETSTAFAQLPAIANTATTLTSNAPSVPNSLALSFPNVQGGTSYQSACYKAADPAGPGLGGIHVLGTPSFYCVLVPGQAGTTTTFGGASTGNVVTFTLGPNAKSDVSFVGLDGPPIYAACTPVSGGQVCNSPPFAIPVYSKAYVSNVADIAACVPKVVGTDCNGVAGNTKAASASKVWQGKEFQLLFADDPTYNAANTFGGVTLQIANSCPCTLALGPDDNHDAPPSYSDPTAPAGSTAKLADFTGVGPYVEFDIIAKAQGTCTLNLTEDTGLKRTFAFQIEVQ